jgi:hypothetical protein
LVLVGSLVWMLVGWGWWGWCGGFLGGLLAGFFVQFPGPESRGSVYSSLPEALPEGAVASRGP